MLKVHAIQGTGVMGDFLNSLPVLSGLSKAYDCKIFLAVQGNLRTFNGMIDLLKYQYMFEDVVYDDEVTIDVEYFKLTSWTRSTKNSEHRPIETSRYENFLNDTYDVSFEVDDDFVLEIPKIELDNDAADYVYIGDRWTTNIDMRRNCNIIKDSGKYNDVKFRYLDYSQTMAYNAALMNKSKYPFISAITGISVLANLMKKEQIVLYDDAMITWDNRSSIMDTYNKHYYSNRNTRIEHIDTFNYA